MLYNIQKRDIFILLLVLLMMLYTSSQAANVDSSIHFLDTHEWLVNTESKLIRHSLGELAYLSAPATQTQTHERKTSIRMAEMSGGDCVCEVKNDNVRARQRARDQAFEFDLSSFVGRFCPPSTAYL